MLSSLDTINRHVQPTPQAMASLIHFSGVKLLALSSMAAGTFVCQLKKIICSWCFTFHFLCSFIMEMDTRIESLGHGKTIERKELSPNIVSTMGPMSGLPGWSP